MANQGDVGVVCNVLYDEQAIVQFHLRMTESGDESSFKGLAVGPFRVEKALHHGYGGGIMSDRDENHGHLSFILVEASRVDDAPIAAPRLSTLFL
jgi:hypothetical protein